MNLLKMFVHRTGTAVLAVLCLTLVPASASAQIYSWRDANGNLVLGNRPRPGAGPEAGEIVRS